MLQESGATCVLACPDGAFKQGWGRSPCVSCGVNFRSAVGATSAQQCYITPGWGSVAARDGSRTLVARKCFHGLYGGSHAQYGNTKRHPCQVCCTVRCHCACCVGAGHGFATPQALCQAAVHVQADIHVVQQRRHCFMQSSIKRLLTRSSVLEYTCAVPICAPCHSAPAAVPRTHDHSRHGSQQQQ
jgi:hypothetical protein